MEEVNKISPYVPIMDKCVLLCPVFASDLNIGVKVMVPSVLMATSHSLTRGFISLSTAELNP